MKKEEHQLYRELSTSVATFIKHLGNGNQKVSPEQEQNIADSLALVAKNKDREMKDNFLYSQVYCMQVDALVKHGQIGILEKLCDKLENQKPFSLFKVPRTLMMWDVKVGNERRFKTLPQSMNFVFGGQERRKSAYTRMFTEHDKNIAAKRAEMLDSGDLIALPAVEKGFNEGLVKEKQLLDHSQDTAYQLAVKDAFELKRRTGSARLQS